MTFNPAVYREEEAVRSSDANTAKAIVMAEVARLVEAGDAVVVTCESGTLELRLATGATFQLGDETVTRIA
jgi:alpha-D-ribose 1-methylphosphonate 5-triphosphate synthase subunit PhnG